MFVWGSGFWVKIFREKGSGVMKQTEKIDYLQTNFMGEWLKTRQQVEDKLSSQNHVFCYCGRLATGLHERTCRKFHKVVNSKAVEYLKHFLEKEVLK